MTDRGFYLRWLFGGLVVLLIIAGACYLWYHYDTAPYRKAASEAEELLRQSEKLKKASKRGNNAEQATDGTAAKSDTQSAERKRTETTPVTKDTEPSRTDKTEPSQAGTPAQNAEMADVPVSPYGFGPYPEVPEDYPLTPAWERNPDNPGKTQELMSRVLIKLWTEGERFDGASTINGNGKIYPHYHDAVYAHWTEWTDKNGKLRREINGFSSGREVRRRFKITYDVLYNPPPGLRVLDIDSSGIYPYEYLNLR